MGAKVLQFDANQVPEQASSVFTSLVSAGSIGIGRGGAVIGLEMGEAPGADRKGFNGGLLGTKARLVPVFSVEQMEAHRRLQPGHNQGGFGAAGGGRRVYAMRKHEMEAAKAVTRIIGR